MERVTGALIAVGFTLLIGCVWYGLGKLRTLRRRLDSELRLVAYDDFLLQSMFQHRLTWEGLQSVRAYSDFAKYILPVGSMFEGSHVPETEGGQVVQEMDFMLILPGLVITESSDSNAQLVLNSSNPGYGRILVHNKSAFTLEMPDFLKSVLTARPYFTRLGDSIYLNRKFVNTFAQRMNNSLSRAFVSGTISFYRRSMKEGDDFYEFSPVVTVRLDKRLISEGSTFHPRLDYGIDVDREPWPDRCITELFMTWFNAINVGYGNKFWEDHIIDLAPALACDWPRKVREQWLTRQRHWPTMDVVQVIADNPCHLLAKPQTETDTASKLLEWRFSFSYAEGLLSATCAPLHRHVLMVLKAIRRKYIQDPKVLASYHLKTTLFRVLETTPKEIILVSGRGGLLNRLMDELILSLQHKSLPNFFMSENNMLRHIAEEDIAKTLKTITHIRENLDKYLTPDLFQSISMEHEYNVFVESSMGAC